MRIDSENMTFDELRDFVAEHSDLPGGTPVILAKDGEGNKYSPLSAISRDLYFADSTYSGKLVQPEDDDEENEFISDGAVHALFFWPVN